VCWSTLVSCRTTSHEVISTLHGISCISLYHHEIRNISFFFAMFLYMCLFLLSLSLDIEIDIDIDINIDIDR